MKRYYPIMLDIQDKKCTVVGGGQVAERKVLSLLDYGAVVTVISPDVTESLLVLFKDARIRWIQRGYQQGDLKDNYLVYVATDDSIINELCLKEAREEEILINIVDKPSMCDFIVPASIQRGDLTITISTHGKSPMMARKIREELENIFGEEYGEYLNHLGEMRKVILQEVEDIDQRKEIFEKIVYSDLFEGYKNGKIEDIGKEMRNLYEGILKGIKD